MFPRFQSVAAGMATLLLVPAVYADTPDQPAARSPRVLSLKPIDELESDSALRKLQRQRYNATVAELSDVYQLFASGRARLDDATSCIESFAVAGSDVAESAPERVRQLELALDVARNVESITDAKHAEGNEPRHSLQHARACRLGIEIQLVRAREAVKTGDRPAEGK